MPDERNQRVKENVDLVICEIEKRHENMKGILQKMIGDMDNHAAMLIKEAQEFSTKQLEQREKQDKLEECPEQEQLGGNHEQLRGIVLPKLIYNPCVFMPRYQPGSLSEAGSENGATKNTIGIPSMFDMDFKDVSLGNLTMESVESSIGSPESMSSCPVAPCSNDSSTNDIDDMLDIEPNQEPAVNHQQVLWNRQCRVNGLLFSPPTWYFCITDKGLFMKKGDRDWEKLNDIPGFSLCLAEKWLFVGMHEEGGSDKIRRYDILGDEPSLGPQEKGDITIKDGQLLLGMTFNSTERLLAVCDAGVKQITVHRVEDGYQVDTLKGQELFHCYCPVDAAWLDSDRVCVLLRLINQPTDAVIHCISLRFKSILWKHSLDKEKRAFLMSSYGRLYVSYIPSKLMVVFSGDGGGIIQEIYSPDGIPFQLVRTRNILTVHSVVKKTN